MSRSLPPTISETADPGHAPKPARNRALPVVLILLAVFLLGTGILAGLGWWAWRKVQTALRPENRNQIALNTAAKIASQLDPNLQVTSGTNGTLTVHDKQSGESMTLDLNAIQQQLQAAMTNQTANGAAANPMFAALQIMTALNPDLEIVSSDPKTGIVVLHDRKSGETTEINVNELQNGGLESLLNGGAKPSSETAPPDPAVISKLREDAANGDPEAQYKLGVAFFNGRGVEKDLPEAARWYESAAEQGHAKAQFNLGLLLLQGEGDIRKDEAGAAKWFRKAAEQGHAKARCKLGRLHLDGTGVAKSNVEAYIWLMLAQQQGVSDVDSLATVATQITPQEMEAAHKRLEAMQER